MLWHSPSRQYGDEASGILQRLPSLHWRQAARPPADVETGLPAGGIAEDSSLSSVAGSDSSSSEASLMLYMSSMF